MKFRFKEFFARIRKIETRKPFLILFDRVVTRKKQIFKIILAITSSFLTSFLIEYFGFGGNFNQYRFLLIAAILLLTAFFVVFRKKIGQYPEIAFLVMSLVCGSLLAVSEPKKYVSWDEQIHFKRTEKMSLAVIGGYSRPNSVSSSFSLDEQKLINEEVDGKYKKALTKSNDGWPSIATSYHNLGYLPSSLAMILSGILHLPYHVIFVLGRLVNVLLFSVVVFFAIRKLKSGKMIMSVIALFPTSIFLAANYGYDSWLTAFTMLGLAYLFSELQQPEKKMTVRDMAIMIGVFVIGLGPKAIYFPLMLFLFLFKPSKFESLSQYKKFMWASALSILFVVGSFMAPFVIGGPGEGDKRGGSAVNASDQVNFILSQPVEYSKILFNFMKVYINPQNADGLVSFFAYLGMTKYFWLVMLVLAIVVLTDKNEFDKKTATLKVRIWVIGIYLMTVALISSALYVSFTAVRSDTIAGVQPRYLIPLLFPLLFVLGSSRIKNPFNKNIYNTIIFVAMSFVLLQGIWDLIIRNYH